MINYDKVISYIRTTRRNLERLEKLLCEEYAETRPAEPDDGILVKVKTVIDMLNRECGTRYSAASKANVRHVAARIKEGYTFDDFVAVVRDRKEKWGGDPKMREYLRPETLFGSKFDSYLGCVDDSRVTNRSYSSNDVERELLERMMAR